MVVTGPRRRALAIPRTTIDRAVDQLLAKGFVGRGYLGAGLQPVRVAGEDGRRAGVLVVSIDPDGPAAKAGLLVGDIVTLERHAGRAHARRHAAAWSDSVGKTAGPEDAARRCAGESNVSRVGERPLN